MMHEPLLLKKRVRRSEGWIAFVILSVMALGMSVGGDHWSPNRANPQHPAASTRMLVPSRPADVATLLNATPLAIAPEDALAINAARPLDRLKLTSARPFVLPVTALDLALGQLPPATAALDCMTKAIYYEAAVEDETGQRAVAQVVLNRMRSPIFPNTVCGVVFQGSELRTGCQFSFTCDGSLLRRPSLAGWLRARRIALSALAGHVERTVGLATHYHANYVVPYWASSLDKISTIGAHIFYTMRGGLGRASAFNASYDRLGESEPSSSVTIDPNGAPTIDGTVTGDPFAGAKPRDRTVVREDALGTLVKPSVVLPATALPAPVAILKADEKASGIAADETRGTLNRQ